MDFAYQPDDWHDFYAALATAYAALLGLFFVAISLHAGGWRASAAAQQSADQPCWTGHAADHRAGLSAAPGQHSRAWYRGQPLLTMVLMAGFAVVAANPTLRSMFELQPPSAIDYALLAGIAAAWALCLHWIWH